MNVEVV